MLNKSEISAINSALEHYLDSAEGFSGFGSEDVIQNAWDEACDYAASVDILGPKLFEKFLKISEENLREACWDNFSDYFHDILTR